MRSVRRGAAFDSNTARPGADELRVQSPHVRSLAIVNMKGGVGKTTTAVQLASALARHGRRVLLVDADPQGNVSHMLGLTPRLTLTDLMLGTATLDDVAGEARPNLDVVASTPAAFALETQLAGAMQRETVLARHLAIPPGRYDVLIIDTSPSMGLLTYSALLAASEFVLTISMDSMAMAGARQTLAGVAEIRRLWQDRPLALAAVVPTAVNPQTHATRAALEALEADPEMASRLFRPGIRQCLDLTYAAAAHQTIWEYAPHSRAAEDYGRLVSFIHPQTADSERTHGQSSKAAPVVRVPLSRS